MADLIAVSCGECGAKYRLPVEFQGRTGKCKKCGARFKVPVEKNIEDSVLDWLTDEDEVHEEEEAVQPRIVDTGKGKPVSTKSGTIRMKESETSDAAE